MKRIVTKENVGSVKRLGTVKVFTDVRVCFVYTEIFRVSTLFVPVFVSPFLNTSNINIFVGGRY